MALSLDSGSDSDPISRSQQVSVQLLKPKTMRGRQMSEQQENRQDKSIWV